MPNPLLPIRHPEQDFFICDFGDVIPKSDIASMEHPLFTLSTKPDRVIRHYEHNGNTVDIVPSMLGLATIHDKDILIFCISQLMRGVNESMDEARISGASEIDPPSRKVRFKAHDLLVTTNRVTSGQGYKLLRSALDRLAGTLITTNIKTNEKTIIEGFGLIDSYKIVIENEKNKRMVELEVTLSEWLYNAVIGCEVLSISRGYFRLRKPIERRIYEIARKHCGTKKYWTIGIEKLHKKVGSSGSIKKFREAVRHIMKHNHLPDYSLIIEQGNIIFRYTGLKAATHGDKQPSNTPIHLKSTTIENAKKILKQRYDVYALEYEWKEWWKNSGCPELKSPDGAFINFCKTRMDTN